MDGKLSERLHCISLFHQDRALSRNQTVTQLQNLSTLTEVCLDSLKPARCRHTLSLLRRHFPSLFLYSFLSLSFTHTLKPFDEDLFLHLALLQEVRLFPSFNHFFLMLSMLTLNLQFTFPRFLSCAF